MRNSPDGMGDSSRGTEGRYHQCAETRMGASKAVVLTTSNYRPCRHGITQRWPELLYLTFESQGRSNRVYFNFHKGILFVVSMYNNTTLHVHRNLYFNMAPAGRPPSAYSLLDWNSKELVRNLGFDLGSANHSRYHFDGLTSNTGR